MKLKNRIAIPSMVILAAFMMLPESANADSFGSWGGNGSWGSSSYGSRMYGSHGGPVRNLLARAPLRTMLGRVRDRVGGWGSGGSWGSGSSGGYGSYGSYGSNGSSGNWGSSGGSWGSSYNYGSTGSTGSSGGSWGSGYVNSSPVYHSTHSNGSYPMTVNNGCVFPAQHQVVNPSGYPLNGQVVEPYYHNGVQGGVVYPEGQGVIQGGGVTQPGGNGVLNPPAEGGGAAEPTPQPSDNDTTMNRRALESLIDIELPADAMVYVNGKLTTKTGSYRTFVARNQKPNRNYRYEIAVEKDGERQVKSFNMLAGGSKSLSFDFSATTVVALEVPENAEVQLAGNVTQGRGVDRKFTTKKLQKGETWDDYKVVVTFEKNGKEIVREKTIDVIGGQAYTLSFVDTVDSDAVVVKKP